jgi:hypothetical protein
MRLVHAADTPRYAEINMNTNRVRPRRRKIIGGLDSLKVSRKLKGAFLGLAFPTWDMRGRGGAGRGGAGRGATGRVTWA